MTRETKIGLLIGTVIILVVGALVSQYLSGPQNPSGPQTPPPMNNVGLEGENGANAAGNHTPPPNPQPQILGNPPAHPATGENIPLVVEDSHLLIGGPHAPGNLALDQNAPTPLSAALTHVVKRGEKARDVAWQYYRDGAQWRLIAKANPGKVDAFGNLQPGVTLVIPARQNPSPTVALGNDRTGAGRSIFAFESTTRPSDSRPPTTAPQSVKAEAGDTLSKIAARYLGSANRWPEILKANSDKLHKATDLREGMVIHLPATSAVVRSDSARERLMPSVRTSTLTVASGNTYTVQAGDTLSSIARKLLGSSSRWSDLYQANKALIGANPAAVKVGQALAIPAVAGGSAPHDRNAPPSTPSRTAVASASLDIPTPRPIVP